MSINILKQRLEGISAINITPFTEEGEQVDEVALRKNINSLLDHDFKIIVPCGNTGEYYSLTLEECETVTKVALKELNGKASGLVGVGYDTKTAIKQSLFAQENGAHGVMIHQPVHPHITEKGLVEYYTEIANAIDIGVVLYVTSNKLTIDGYRKLMDVENIVGVKYSIKDPFGLAEITQKLKDWDIVWVCGLAESWAPFFFQSGAEGFTSGLANIAPEKSNAMLSALKNNNKEESFKLWHEIKPFEDLRAKYGDGNNVAVVKAGMNLIGGNVGNVRPPVNPLNKEDETILIDTLKQWDYL